MIGLLFIKHPLTIVCKTCGTQYGHSVDCPDIDLQEAKRQLRLYHNLWLTKENWVRKRSNMWRSEAERWKGKFIEVKHENNQLRKKKFNP